MAAVGTEAAATEQGGPSLMQTFHESQRQVARLSVPEEARLIVELGRWAPSHHLPIHDVYEPPPVRRFFVHNTNPCSSAPVQAAQMAFTLDFHAGLTLWLGTSVHQSSSQPLDLRKTTIAALGMEQPLCCVQGLTFVCFSDSFVTAASARELQCGIRPVSRQCLSCCLHCAFHIKNVRNAVQDWRPVNCWRVPCHGGLPPGLCGRVRGGRAGAPHLCVELSVGAHQRFAHRPPLQPHCHCTSLQGAPPPLAASPLLLLRPSFTQPHIPRRGTLLSRCHCCRRYGRHQAKSQFNCQNVMLQGCLQNHARPVCHQRRSRGYCIITSLNACT